MSNNKEFEVKNVNKLFRDLFDLQKSGNYFFRGISEDKNYSPSLFNEFRRIKKGDADYTDVWGYEIKLLERFAQYSVQYLPAISTPLDWVASAQHFGIPTRLLDWTSDPFCGLYFSVFYNPKDNVDTSSDKEDDWYRLLVVNKNNHLYFSEVPIFKPSRTDLLALDSNYELLNEFIALARGLSRDSRHDLAKYARGSYHSREKKFTRELKKELKENSELTKLFFCSINHSNPRIVAQNGLFQIPRKYGYGEGKGNIKDDIIDGCETIFKIHKNQRKEILDRLLNMNINSIRLFPDLQNICEYIKRTTK